jgi:hypothetical protein
MSLRIRQIVFAAAALEPSVTQFGSAFGTRVVYRDAEVASFGLVNALLPIGDQFIEVVAPMRPDAAVARPLARHGDSAYMLILQTDDLAADRQRLERLGVRIIQQSSHADMSSVQLHPKDVGAAIVSLDQPVPAAAWRWAGPSWQADSEQSSAEQARSGQRKAEGVIREVGIAAHAPEMLARRWAEVLGTQAPERDGNTWQIPIIEGCLRFHATTGGERISHYVIETPQPAETMICGTRFELVRPRSATG